MPTVITKSIKAVGGNYATHTLFEAAADKDLVAADEQWDGENYDEAYDEIVTFDGGTSDSTRFIRVLPASGQEGNGTAGTGPRIQPTSLSQGDIVVALVDEYVQLINFEIGPASAAFTAGASYGVLVTADNCTMRLLLLHGIKISKSNRGIEVTNAGSRVLRNIVYNIDRNDTGNAKGIVTFLAAAGVIDILGNMCDNINIQKAFFFEGTTHTLNVKNCIGMNSTQANFDFGDMSGTINTDGCMSEDATADDNGDGTHAVSVTRANQFVNITLGSEDYHLKTGSDAIGLGADLVTSPPGVEIDIDGYDVDAGGDTWDSGPDQFGKPAAGGGRIMSSLAAAGGLAGVGGIAGYGGGLAA